MRTINKHTLYIDLATCANQIPGLNVSMIDKTASEMIDVLVDYNHAIVADFHRVVFVLPLYQVVSVKSMHNLVYNARYKINNRRTPPVVWPQLLIDAARDGIRHDRVDIFASADPARWIATSSSADAVAITRDTIVLWARGRHTTNLKHLYSAVGSPTIEINNNYSNTPTPSSIIDWCVYEVKTLRRAFSMSRTTVVNATRAERWDSDTFQSDRAEDYVDQMMGYILAECEHVALQRINATGRTASALDKRLTILEAIHRTDIIWFGHLLCRVTTDRPIAARGTPMRVFEQFDLFHDGTMSLMQCLTAEKTALLRNISRHEPKRNLPVRLWVRQQKMVENLIRLPKYGRVSVPRIRTFTWEVGRKEARLYRRVKSERPNRFAGLLDLGDTSAVKKLGRDETVDYDPTSNIRKPKRDLPLCTVCGKLVQDLLKHTKAEHWLTCPVCTKSFETLDDHVCVQCPKCSKTMTSLKKHKCQECEKCKSFYVLRHYCSKCSECGVKFKSKCAEDKHNCPGKDNVLEKSVDSGSKRRLAKASERDSVETLKKQKLDTDSVATITAVKTRERSGKPNCVRDTLALTKGSKRQKLDGCRNRSRYTTIGRLPHANYTYHKYIQRSNREWYNTLTVFIEGASHTTREGLLGVCLGLEAGATMDDVSNTPNAEVKDEDDNDTIDVELDVSDSMDVTKMASRLTAMVRGSGIDYPTTGLAALFVEVTKLFCQNWIETLQRRYAELKLLVDNPGTFQTIYSTVENSVDIVMDRLTPVGRKLPIAIRLDPSALLGIAKACRSKCKGGRVRIVDGSQYNQFAVVPNTDQLTGMHVLIGEDLTLEVVKRMNKANKLVRPGLMISKGVVKLLERVPDYNSEMQIGTGVKLQSILGSDFKAGGLFNSAQTGKRIHRTYLATLKDLYAEYGDDARAKFVNRPVVTVDPNMHEVVFGVFYPSRLRLNRGDNDKYKVSVTYRTFGVTAATLRNSSKLWRIYLARNPIGMGSSFASVAASVFQSEAVGARGLGEQLKVEFIQHVLRMLSRYCSEGRVGYKTLDPIILYGDGQFTSNTKGLVGFGQTLIRELSKHCFVMFSEEFRTSQVCSVCHANEPMTPVAVGRHSPFKHMRCMRCVTGEGVTRRNLLFQRDVNAFLNMFRNALETTVLGDVARIFRRTRNTRRAVG